MKKSLNVFLGGVFVCLSMLQPGQAPSTTAQAAGSLVIYVDDLPDNNGSVNCPATDVHSLDDMMSRLGMTLTNITIYVCPGEYIPPGGGLHFNNFTNLKIIGKGSPGIKPPVGFNGSVFYVSSSTNVTIQGFTIDGGAQLDPLAVAAIRWEDTSGTITGNTISGWRRPYSGPPPFDVGLANPMHSIFVNGNGSSTKKVLISNNTIYDSQDTGILVGNYSAFSTPVKIVKNRVTFGSLISPAFAPAAIVRIQAGIALVNSGPGGVISGNEVSSDPNSYPTTVNYDRGIMVYGTPGTKITGNIVRGTARQISVENWCNIVGIDASKNVISGNKLYDTWLYGIHIVARNDQVSTGFNCNALPHADFIKVTGNTIYNLNFNPPFAQYGVYLETQGGTQGGVISNVTVTGNTIAGFPAAGTNPHTVHYSDPSTIPNAVLGPNKILPVPPAGAYK